MKIRLISGQFGGRTLDTPSGNKTHPAGERVRGAMFNSLGDLPRNAEVLDAFAGSGSLGLEALSRGAKHATFIEKDRIANKVISENIESLGVQNVTKNIKAGVVGWIEKKKKKKFDLIFVDPPYHDMQFSTVSRLFYHLKKNGVMVLSHIGSSEVLKPESNIVVVDNRSYGNAHLTYYRKVN